MNTYVAIQLNLQSAEPVHAHGQPPRLTLWLRGFLASRSAARTRKVLSTLDRATLEDIGVPHDKTSPRAGALDRYPQVIIVEQQHY